MVQEVRSILFTAEECRAAVTSLLVLRTRGLRPEQVISVVVGPTIAAIATLRPSVGVQTTQVLNATDLMSAVLLFCRRAHIPLSTRSHKHLRLIDGCLALTTSINLRAAMPVMGRDPLGPVASGPDLALMHRV